MCGEEFFVHRLPNLAVVLRHTDVLLFIHSFQFGVEATNHHVLETVGLDACPVFHLVGRDVLRITSHVVRRVGIRALCTDGRHQLVILIRDEILCGKLAHTVNLMVSFLACHGVGQLSISLETLLDLVQ